MGQPTFEHLATFGSEDTGLTALCDVVLTQAPDGTRVVYGTVRADEETGLLAVKIWTVDESGAYTLRATVHGPAQALAGVDAKITIVSAEQSGTPHDLMLVTGLAGIPVWSLEIDGTGGPSDHTISPDVTWTDEFCLTTTVSVNGASYFYGSCAGAGLPAIYQMSGNGQWGQVAPSGASEATNSINAVVGVAVATVDAAYTGDTPLLVYAMDGDTVLKTYSVGGSGQLTERGEINVSDGHGIAHPSVMDVVILNDQAFAVMGASGSSTISVAAIGQDGSLSVTDHVFDTLETRFASVSVLETITVGNVAYVAVAGGDQGLTVFRLFDNGTLQTIGSLEDTVTAVVDDVSALLLSFEDGFLNVSTFSGSEEGVSVFSLDVGMFGLEPDAPSFRSVSASGDQIIDGTAADETLEAQEGLNIIIDGGGRDTMIGGTGADTFILSNDHLRDEIHNFDPLQDKIDLSHWPFLRAVSQLAFSETPDGCEIVFGSEVLRIYTADGGPLTIATIEALGLLDTSRFLQSWFDEIEFDPHEADTFSGTPDMLSGTTQSDTLQGSNAADVISGLGGADRIEAGRGEDVVSGGAGNDDVFGGGGNDDVFGDAGDDMLFGNLGDDVVYGGDDNDGLYGGVGNDWVFGGAGDDQLFGDSGMDTLVAGEGADSLRGNSGADMMYGDGGDDYLNGGVGHDTLNGGDGLDVLVGLNGNDALYGGADVDVLSGNAGQDALWGGFGDDVLSGGIGFDSLEGNEGSDVLNGNAGFDFLWGGDGDDFLFGNSGNDYLDGGDGNDVLTGGQGADTFVFRSGHDRIDDLSLIIDRVLIDGNLIGSASQSGFDAAAWGTIENGSIVLDFGDGTLTLSDISNFTALNDLIDFT